MSGTRTIHALGIRVDVHLGTAIDPEEFDRAWSRCLVDREAASPDEAPGEPVGPHATMTTLTQAITRELISRRRGELLMLHAGAVCNTRSGHAIAYAAPGGTGKTTLSRLLGQRYGYLTDETVGIDPATRGIYAYEKPLSLRTREGAYPKSEIGPDELGLVSPHPEPRLTTLAILRRTPSRAVPAVTRLDLFDAITTLAPETSSLSRLPRPLHLLAELEADLGGIWLLEYSEAEHVAAWVDEQLRQT